VLLLFLGYNMIDMFWACGNSKFLYEQVIHQKNARCLRPQEIAEVNIEKKGVLKTYI
jgi:hypothetical protein